MSKAWPGSHHHPHHMGGGGQQATATTGANAAAAGLLLMDAQQPSSSCCAAGSTAGTASTNGMTLMTRTLLVHISGNRATWDHRGQHGAMWQINPDRAATIFTDATGAMAAGTMLMMMTDGLVATAEQAGALDRLSRAMIRNVTVLESNTNVNEVVAVQVEGLPSREFTRNGEGASLFLTGEGRVTTPQVIFNVSGNSELGMQWMRQFPRYTSENLETEGTMFLTGASYYFVHQEHPVIYFLKANEEQLGIVCFQEPSLEGGWIRIDLDTFVYAVRTLRETVLRNTPSTFNLSQLTVRIGKPNGQRWVQVCPQLIQSLIPDEVQELDDADALAEARKTALKRYFDQPLYVTLRLSIEYMLPEMSSGALLPAASILATTAAGLNGATGNGNGSNNSNPNHNNSGNNSNGGGKAPGGNREGRAVA